MSLRYALLGVLEARPMTGYELTQFFGQSAAWVWSAPQSNIYPELRRMENEGLLVATTDVRGEKLERRTYSLTDLGLARLLKWAVTDPTPSYLRDPLFVKIGFLDLTDPSDAAPMLRDFIVQQKELVAGWEEHIRQLREREAPLLKERLKHRPSEIHEAVAELKANAFQGLIDVSRARSDCAERALRILETMPDGDT